MIRAVDLFAGAGGCSTGLLQAATKRGDQVELVAVNHWPVSVATHTRNHPEARHFCASIETLDPKVAVPGGRLELLIAAPECVFHSTARGGKPIDDQRRASAWHVLRWLEHLHVDDVLIENVPEFVKWGPLGLNNKPLKSKAGQIFKAFIAAIEALNYRVEWKVLNAADYGAATTRRRLFIRARRGGKRIAWPEATHSRTGGATLFGGRKRWRAAREIIDWTLPSQSIFTRKKPLQPATIRRIIEGLRRFGGEQLEPFLVQLTHGGRVMSADSPLPTVTTANRGEMALAEPFIVQSAHGSGGGRGDSGRVHSVDTPVGAIPASNRFALAEPFLVPFYGERAGQEPRTHSIDEPVPVIPASGDGKFAVIEPFVLSQGGGGVARHIDQPAPTIVTDGAVSLVEPFIVPPRGFDQTGAKVDAVDDPLRTVTAVAGHTFGLVEPFIITPGGANLRNGRAASDPLPTVMASDRLGVVEPFLTKYTSTGQAYSVDQPIDTVTTKDRFGLVQPVVDGYTLDIRFRMLQPHELAAAMSFPKSYVFTGNKGDVIRQVGNAVDCRMAEALCGSILDARTSRATPRKAIA